MPSATLCRAYLVYIYIISEELAINLKIWKKKSVLALVAGEITTGHGTGSKAIRASSQEEIQS